MIIFIIIKLTFNWLIVNNYQDSVGDERDKVQGLVLGAVQFGHHHEQVSPREDGAERENNNESEGPKMVLSKLSIETTFY